MKYKIILIKKRGFFGRIGIHYWKVKVEIEGKFYTFNCWASIDRPSIGSLLWDLEDKIKSKFGIEKKENQEDKFIKEAKKLEGRIYQV